MRMGAGREDFHPRTIAHWDLVVEALGRILVIYTLPEGKRPPYGMLDVTGYFVLAYHVRDYLEQLDGRTDVDAFVRSEPALARCRDLSVNLKHARMASKPMSPGGDGLSMAGDRASFPGGPGVYNRVVIDLDGQQLDGYDLAAEAFFAWHRYGLPLQDHTSEAWSLAPTVENPSGVVSSVLPSPKPIAWSEHRLPPEGAGGTSM